ncbi:MAG: NitT/TauT family transport system substrate-binding protein [Verrucomicrobiota bacterium]
MKRKTFLGLIVPVVIAIVAVTYVARKPVSAKQNRIVVGLLSWPGDGPLYVGDEKGFFREEGIDLKIQFIESYDSRRAALVAKQIDVDCTTLDQLLIYAENNVDARVYGLSDFSQGGDGIVAKKNIVTLKDLRGKTVAYAEATPSDFLLRWLLKREGINLSDIARKPVADAQAAGTAILAEQVDAAVTYEPWLTKSGENHNLHILASTKEFPDLIPGLFIARKSDLEARKQLYRAFMQAWYRSVDYFRANPQVAKEIMARRMGLPPSDFESVLGSIRIVAKDENQKAFAKNSSPNLYELVDTISGFWRENGFIKEARPPESLLFVVTDQEPQR